MDGLVQKSTGVRIVAIQKVQISERDPQIQLQGQVADREIIASLKIIFNSSRDVAAHGSDPALYIGKVPEHRMNVRKRKIRSNALFGCF